MFSNNFNSMTQSNCAARVVSRQKRRGETQHPKGGRARAPTEGRRAAPAQRWVVRIIEGNGVSGQARS